MVDLVPGMMTTSAWAGTAAPGWTNSTVIADSSHQGIEIIEIGDAPQAQDGDPDRAVIGRRPHAVEHQAVLGRQPAGVAPMRNDAEAWYAGALLEEFSPGVEQCRVAMEIVDQRGADQRRIGWVEHHESADQRGNHAAAMDVADEDDGDVGGAGEPHIGEVAVAEIDLGRGAGTLHDDEVGSAGEALEAFAAPPAESGRDGRNSRGPRALPRGGPGRSPGRRRSPRA